MKDLWNVIQLIFTVIGGWIGYFFGEGDGLIKALIVFVICDYITGVMCATIDKKLSSEVGYKGIYKKVLIFMLIGIAHTLDVYAIGNGNILKNAVVFFYLSNEGISIIENATHLGLPVPEKMKNVLEELHGRSDDKGE